MKNKIVLFAFILLMSFSIVSADIPPPDRSSENEKQGICFLPLIIGGTLFSLSLVVVGLRIIRKQENRGKQQETTE
ncbi:MAG TPA: hypothetical protein PKY59_11045 [Pyrinomonadaceae bacterium]|nr:hypothetical protein [Pyrinomonadaceae bacterium]